MLVFKTVYCRDCKKRKEIDSEPRKITCHKCGSGNVNLSNWTIRWYKNRKPLIRTLPDVTKKEAMEARMAAVNGSEYIRLSRKAPIQFGQACDQYLDHCKHEAGYDNKRHHLKIWKEILGERKPIYEISKETIIKGHDRLSHEKSPSTANRYLATLKNFYTYAESIEWIDYTILHAIRKIEKLDEPENDGRYLLLDEYPRLIQATDISPCLDLTDITHFAMFTGLRMSNVLGCRYDIHIDLDSHLLKYPKSQKKGKRRQGLPMGPFVYQMIANRPRHETSPFLFYNRCDTKRHRAGEPYTKDQIEHYFGTALDNAGITDFSFHKLRHTMGTGLALTGSQSKDIQLLMDHASMDMTGIYTHLNVDFLRDSVERVERMFIESYKGKGPDNTPNFKIVSGGER